MEMTELMKQKISNGREYRLMDMECRENGEDNYTIEGYATTFNQPYHLYYYDDEGHEVKEQVSDRAFDKTDMSDTILQFDHEGKVYARISNDTLKLKTDEHGLFVRAYLGGTQIGRNLYEEIKGGYINKMSFGFTVTDDSVEPDGKDYLRTIRSIGRLYDVSVVSIPQNDFTEVSARSHCDGAIAEIEAERLQAEEEARKLCEQKESLLMKVKALRGERNGN